MYEDVKQDQCLLLFKDLYASDVSSDIIISELAFLFLFGGRQSMAVGLKKFLQEGESMLFSPMLRFKHFQSLEFILQSSEL